VQHISYPPAIAYKALATTAHFYAKRKACLDGGKIPELAVEIALHILFVARSVQAGRQLVLLLKLPVLPAALDSAHYSVGTRPVISGNTVLGGGGGAGEGYTVGSSST
jgi:hypothetical protein